MSLPRIRDEWHVPAHLGRRVTVTTLDETGTITGSEGDYVQVELVGGTRIYIHPTDIDWS